MILQVYTDGSATTKGNPGGWGSVILIDGILHKELSGYLESATNNDAELIGAIKGLEYALDLISINPGSFPIEYDITLISDSEIVLNWANGKYKFKQIDKIDSYDRLRFLVKKLKVKTQWVRGHSGNIWNSRCDKLANNARKGISTNLDKPLKKGDTRIGHKKNSVVSLYYGGKLKILDFDLGIIEDYNRDVHGKRGSIIEIRKVKRDE